jgi:hypothetical protein
MVSASAAMYVTSATVPNAKILLLVMAMLSPAAMFNHPFSN